MAKTLMRELLRHRNFHSSSSQSPSQSPSSSSNLSFKDRLLTLIKTCQNPTHFYQIHAHFITSGFYKNPSLAGRLLNLSSHFNNINYTLLIFKFIHFPDTYCVNTAIKSYASSSCCSLPDTVFRFYFDMRKENEHETENENNVLFRPNKFTFPPMISSCAKARCLRIGRMCHGQVVKFGCDDSLFVENSLVHMYGVCGVKEDAWKVFDEMCVRDLVSLNSMVDGYVKGCEMGKAHLLFDKMPERNVVSWNVVMKGYLDDGNPSVVLKLFRKMVGTGVRGNDTTVVCVVTACGRSCRLKEGRSVHGSIIRMLTGASLIIGTSLIDMYSRCGRTDVAQIIFDRMLIKNLVCWNAMITGHSIHGKPEHGVSLFDKMLKLGNLVPDEVTYIGVLCAFARLGLLPEGKKHFLEMTESFNVKPNFAHYWCMANLYASHGLVNDAVEFLKNMPVDINISPQSSLVGSLLGSCRFKGDVAIGEQIAKALIEEYPLNHSYHVLLIVIYAVAGQWDDVSRMKCMMKERGITVPGFSLLELTETVNSLEVGDKWEDSVSRLQEHG